MLIKAFIGTKGYAKGSIQCVTFLKNNLLTTVFKYKDGSRPTIPTASPTNYYKEDSTFFQIVMEQVKP